MYHIVKGYQDIFLYDTIPAFMPIGILFVISLLLGMWSLHIYRKHVGEMVDEL